MSKIMVVYWSGTGNTEKMAEAVAKGAEGKGASVECRNVSSVSVADLAGYDVVALGSPSMGVEVIEEGEMEPFFSEALPGLKGKKVGIFGSYGWGDGEWLRTWGDRCRDGGVTLMDDGLAVHETPDDAALADCVAWGEKLAAF